MLILVIVKKNILKTISRLISINKKVFSKNHILSFLFNMKIVEITIL